jgi:hypothetical protein
MDKVTVWFRENVRDPLRDRREVVFATVAFRWFNWIPTGEILLNYFRTKRFSRFGLLECWSLDDCIQLLGRHRDKGEKIFTGAFLINSPPRKRKLEAIAERIDNVWRDRESLVADLEKCTTLEAAHKRLTAYDGMGGFMAYEVVCDLRYTYLLEDATDIMSWCNPGPGCVRGLYRLNGWDWENKAASHGYAPPKPKDFLEQMRKLLATMNERLPRMPALEMREAEHSLCESDKYERALWGDGDMKRVYDGRA